MKIARSDKVVIAWRFPERTVTWITERVRWGIYSEVVDIHPEDVIDQITKEM